MFTKGFFLGVIKLGLCGKDLKMVKMAEFVFDRVENTLEKEKIMLITTIFSVSYNIFKKAELLGSLNLDCLV